MIVFVLMTVDQDGFEAVVAAYGLEVEAKMWVAKLNNVMTGAERDEFTGFSTDGLTFFVEPTRWHPAPTFGEYLDPSR